MSEHWKEENFIEYLDRRAAPEARTRLEAHLAECADCRRQLEALRALASVLEEWTPAPVSPGFEARLHARLADERAAPRGWFVLRPAFGLGLAAMAALAVAVMLWQPLETDVVQVKPQSPAATTSGPESVAPQVSPAGTKTSSSETEELAVLENSVLLNDYELLEQFDVLFEPLENEAGKTL